MTAKATQKTITCPICNTEFLTKRSTSTTCSSKCGKRLYYEKHHVNVACINCGKVFSSFQSNKATCCSTHCAKIITWKNKERPEKPVEKKCGLCGLVYPYTQQFFSSKTKSIHGLSSNCLKCNALRHKLWRKQCPEKWQRARKISKMSRRARESGRSIRKKINAKDLEDMYENQDGKCEYCAIDLGLNYHLDHILPLARGGTDDLSNLCLACPHCNLSKNRRTVEEWKR